MTDEDGRFVLTSLEPGRYHYRLEASVPGHFSTHLPSQQRQVAAGEQGIVLALGVPGGVRGVALDPFDAPLTAGRISYSRVGAEKPMVLDPELDHLLDSFHHDRSGNYLSFDQGAFTVDHLEPGLWRIEVGSLGYAPGTRCSPTYKLCLNQDPWSFDPPQPGWARHPQRVTPCPLNTHRGIQV